MFDEEPNNLAAISFKLGVPGSSEAPVKRRLARVVWSAIGIRASFEEEANAFWIVEIGVPTKNQSAIFVGLGIWIGSHGE
jgi:hypothetical protein